MVDIAIPGLDGIIRDFGKLNGELQEAALKATRQSLQMLISLVKEDWPVKTGRSRASLGATTSLGINEVKSIGGGIVGRMGSRVVYAPVIEFGTKDGRRKGLYIMERVAKTNVERVVGIFQKILGNAIKGVFG